MLNGKVGAGVVVGLAALSTSASAQEARRLDFGLEAAAEYNSNVARTSEELANLRGIELADTIFTPAATIDALLPLGKHSVFLNGRVGYSFYNKNTELNRERLDLTAGLNGQVGPCQTTLSGTFTRGVNQLEDPVLIDDPKNIQETKQVGINVACMRGSGLGLVGSASKVWTDNDQPLAQQSDAERSSLTLGVSYSRPALGTITLFGNRDKAEYPNRIVGGGYELTGIGVSYERQLGARIQGSVSIASTTVEQQGPLAAEGDLETLSYSADLSYRASSRLKFKALFDRSVTPSAAIGRSYDIAETYSFGGDYNLGSRITVNLGVSRVERESDGLMVPGVSLTDSRTDAVFGTVRYKQSERLAFVLTAGREERTTNAPLFDYKNTRIGLAAQLSF